MVIGPQRKYYFLGGKGGVGKTSCNLKRKLSSATSAIKSVFRKAEEQQDVPEKLEQLRERMKKVRDLFQNSNTTEFVIVNIPSHLNKLLHSFNLFMNDARPNACGVLLI